MGKVQSSSRKGKSSHTQSTPCIAGKISTGLMPSSSDPSDGLLKKVYGLDGDICHSMEDQGYVLGSNLH